LGALSTLLPQEPIVSNVALIPPVVEDEPVAEQLAMF